MIAPGLYLIISSGSKTEVRTDRGLEDAGLGSGTLLGVSHVW
jgi:hypothetical protein